MRHNQNNNRRFRGHNNGGGGGQRHHHNNGGNGGNRQRAVNPRVQTFDSNGPEVRIRGNAIQITEKYLTLARDALSAGDRVLAESYFQHAEHYQRMLNEANEEFARNNPQAFQQQQQREQQQQQAAMGEGEQPVATDGSGEQPQVPLNDLDQGFLVGNRQPRQPQSPQVAAGEGEQPSEQQPRVQQQGRGRRTPPKEAETA